MRRVQNFFLLLILGLVLSYQGCTGCDSNQTRFTSGTSVSGSTTPGGGGDGEPLEGKPQDGTYYRNIPGFLCAGQSAIHSYITVAGGKASLFTTMASNCAVVESDLALSDLAASALDPSVVGMKDAVYVRYDQPPTPQTLATSPAIETWCTADLGGQAYDLSASSDPTTHQIQMRITGSWLSSGQWTEQPAATLAVHRNANGRTLSYSATGLSLQVNGAQPNLDGTSPGQIAMTYQGQSIQALASCRLAYLFDDRSPIVPAFSFDLTGSGLSSLLTYTRSGPASVFGADGNIQKLTDNQPRHDYDPVSLNPSGLLFEEPRTNSLLGSEMLASAPWSASAVNVGSAGQLVGLSLFSITNGNPTQAQPANAVMQSVTVNPGDYEVLSFFVRPGNQSVARLWIVQSATQYASVDFDLTSQNWNFNTGSGITLEGAWSGRVQGGYRVAVQFSASASSIAVGIGSQSTAAGSSILATGAQLEIGNGATSYIPTTTSIAARGEEFLNATDLSSWNASEGSIQIDVTRTGMQQAVSDANPFAWTVNGSGGDSYVLSEDVASSTFAMDAQVSSLQTHWNSAANLVGDYLSRQRVIFNYQSGNSSLVLNGQASAGPANAPVGLQAVSLRIGGGAKKWSGHVALFTYWPHRLDDTQAAAQTR